MRMSVSDARAFSAALSSAADEAEKSGNADFDLIDSVQALDNAARADLQSAIEAAKASG